MNNYFKIKSKNRNLTAGFTLLELIVASAMTLGVITIAGIGIAQITKANIKSSIESQVQYDLNRTVAFTSTEIKKSYEVSTQPPTDVTNDSTIPSGTFPSGATHILLLRNTSLSAPIVYFTLPGTNTYVSQNWLMAKGKSNLVLYRWGPVLDEVGNYLSPDAPEDWEIIPVADMLSSDSVSPSCTSGWSSIPSSSAQKGIYLCVKSTGAGAKKQVAVYATTKVKSDRLAQDKQNEQGDEVEYEVKTEVYARSDTP